MTRAGVVEWPSCNDRLHPVVPGMRPLWRADLLAVGVSISVAAKAYRLLRAVLMTAAEDDNIISTNRAESAGPATSTLKNVRCSPSPRSSTSMIVWVAVLSATSRSSPTGPIGCGSSGTARCALAAGMLRPGLDLSQAPPGMAPSAEQFAALDEIAHRYGATRIQVALAWLLGHSPVTLAIPGTSSLAHLEENMAAADLVLSDEDLVAVNKLA
ncbi:aldo/keto reductase [Planotetraspora phitsanulokensis]|nr:aldo/keto reductase [Planotetraspora phitsanulokensis]